MLENCVLNIGRFNERKWLYAGKVKKQKIPIRAQGGIVLHVNSDKTESMCFNQRDDISILKGRSLKLVD